LAAALLDHRGEFVTLGHFHADPGDIGVGDLPAAAIDQIPIDLDLAAVVARDLAEDDGLVAVRPGAYRAKRLAGIFGQPGAVSLRQVFVEQLEELLLLLRRGHPPIAPEDELADAGNVEIRGEQLAEPLETLRRRHILAEHLDRLGAELADKGYRVALGHAALRRNRPERQYQAQ